MIENETSPRPTANAIYVDGSALAKCMLGGPGADLALSACESAGGRFTSPLAITEARGALARARRAGLLDEADARSAVARLDDLRSRLEPVPFDAALAEHAGELADRHELRSGAAAHLATALAIEAPRVVVLSWDRRLAGAAVDQGLATVPQAPVAAAA